MRSFALSTNVNIVVSLAYSQGKRRKAPWYKDCCDMHNNLGFGKRCIRHRSIQPSENLVRVFALSSIYKGNIFRFIVYFFQ
jgi:hypothetical protein